MKWGYQSFKSFCLATIFSEAAFIGALLLIFFAAGEDVDTFIMTGGAGGALTVLVEVIIVVAFAMRTKLSVAAIFSSVTSVAAAVTIFIGCYWYIGPDHPYYNALVLIAIGFGIKVAAGIILRFFAAKSRFSKPAADADSQSEANNGNDVSNNGEAEYIIGLGGNERKLKNLFDKKNN